MVTKPVSGELAKAQSSSYDLQGQSRIWVLLSSSSFDIHNDNDCFHVLFTYPYYIF